MYRLALDLLPRVWPTIERELHATLLESGGTRHQFKIRQYGVKPARSLPAREKRGRGEHE